METCEIFRITYNDRPYKLSKPVYHEKKLGLSNDFRKMQ
jgi:hypothetical protein